MTVTSDVPDLSPAAFAAELEERDPSDPIAAAWRWRLDGSKLPPNGVEGWAPWKWTEAQLAYKEWYDRTARERPGIAAHLSDLGRRGPGSQPSRSSTVDGMAITKTMLAGVVAMLDELVDAQSVSTGRQARWRRNVDRLRDLVGDLQNAGVMSSRPLGLYAALPKAKSQSEAKERQPRRPLSSRERSPDADRDSPRGETVSSRLRTADLFRGVGPPSGDRSDRGVADPARADPRAPGSERAAPARNRGGGHGVRRGAHGAGLDCRWRLRGPRRSPGPRAARAPQGRAGAALMDPVFSDPLIMSFLVRGLTRQDLSTAEGQALVTRRLIELRRAYRPPPCPSSFYRGAPGRERRRLMDPISNLAYGTVATAPSPATSGTSLTLTTGQGANFPVGSFDVVVWPTGSIPTSNNAEIARATRTSGSDALTLVRAQYGTTAQSVTTSYAVYQAIDQNLFSQLAALNPVPGGAPLASVANQQILSSTRKVPHVMDSRNYGGTATGGSTTTLINSGVSFPATLVGWTVLGLTGPGNGQQPVITSITTTTNPNDTLHFAAQTTAFTSASTYSIVPGATPVLDTDSFDCFILAGMNEAITGITLSPTGIGPQALETLRLGFLDNGTARAVTLGSGFESPGSLFTKTIPNTLTEVLFDRDTANSAWRLIGQRPGTRSNTSTSAAQPSACRRRPPPSPRPPRCSRASTRSAWLSASTPSVRPGTTSSSTSRRAPTTRCRRRLGTRSGRGSRGRRPAATTAGPSASRCRSPSRRRPPSPSRA